MVQIQPTADNILRNRESHTRKCMDGSDPTYSRQHSPKPRIPHTEVCGWFRPNLHRQHSPKPRKSHTRKCVDCSDPTYKTMPLIGLKSEFSFMGHSNRSNRLDLNNPHTSVCGIFSVSESVGSGRPDPHASGGWMVSDPASETKLPSGFEAEDLDISS